MITQEILKEILNYNPETGLFTWIKPNSNRVKSGAVAGTLTNNGYILISINGNRYLAHRLAWMYTNGYFPLNDTDHIDGDKSNNRIKNIRLASRSESNQNRRNSKVNSCSKYIGVSWNKEKRKWTAQIQVDGKQKKLGYFNSEIDAHNVYIEAKRKLHPFGNI